MPQVPMFHRLSFPRRNSRSVAKFEQQGRADGHSVASADDYSVDEDGCVWRVVQKYCTDYRAAIDVHDVVYDIYMRGIACRRVHASERSADGGELCW